MKIKDFLSFNDAIKIHTNKNNITYASEEDNGTPVHFDKRCFKNLWMLQLYINYVLKHELLMKVSSSTGRFWTLRKPRLMPT